MRIGIILTGDYTWAGGLYYSLNIIKLLSEISSSKKLKVLVLINSSASKEIIDEIPLLNTEIVTLDKKPFFYKLYHKILGNRFSTDINQLNLTILYPLITYDKKHSKLNCKVYYWLYDFQHKFLPQLFSKQELEQREINFRNIVNSGSSIVLSSNDAKSHLERFYPKNNTKLLVYKFVTIINKIETQDSIKDIVSIPKNYFIVCNQFWPHKNHLIVLKALKELVNENKNVHLVFTGKNDDPKSKHYLNEINDFITENNLQRHVIFTGFISRNQQVQLIQNSIAVIQPSLFEGWSTVVEDAKALNKFLLLSNLPVHQEQVKDFVCFFNPSDYFELATQLSACLKEIPISINFNYQKNINQSKENLIQLFNLN